MDKFWVFFLADIALVSTTPKFTPNYVKCCLEICMQLASSFYDRVYSIKNTRITLSIVWLIGPVLLLLPLLELWGRFMYDERRFLCCPRVTKGTYRIFLTTVGFLLSFPPILFCYV